MAQYAFLVGSAPQDYRQKRLVNFYNNLKSEYSFAEKDIYIFPNGVDEILLEYALINAIEKKPTKILLYICTITPMFDSDESIWIGGEEVRKSVIERYTSLLGNCFQVIYDSDHEVINETELGYEYFFIKEN